MGKAQSKRSVDITTEDKKGIQDEITGKLEKIDDIGEKQINGDTIPEEKTDSEKKDADESENDKDLTTEKNIEATPTQPSNETNCTEQPAQNVETSPKIESTEEHAETKGEEVSPLADESGKKSKKEKVKKKWSFRNISFGKKDKLKPAKTEESADTTTVNGINGETENKAVEEALPQSADNKEVQSVETCKNGEVVETAASVEPNSKISVNSQEKIAETTATETSATSNAVLDDTAATNITTTPIKTEIVEEKLPIAPVDHNTEKTDTTPKETLTNGSGVETTKEDVVKADDAIINLVETDIKDVVVVDKKIVPNIIGEEHDNNHDVEQVVHQNGTNGEEAPNAEHLKKQIEVNQIYNHNINIFNFKNLQSSIDNHEQSHVKSSFNEVEYNATSCIKTEIIVNEVDIINPIEKSIVTDVEIINPIENSIVTEVEIINPIEKSIVNQEENINSIKKSIVTEVEIINPIEKSIVNEEENINYIEKFPSNNKIENQDFMGYDEMVVQIQMQKPPPLPITTPPLPISIFAIGENNTAGTDGADDTKVEDELEVQQLQDDINNFEKSDKLVPLDDLIKDAINKMPALNLEECETEIIENEQHINFEKSVQPTGNVIIDSQLATTDEELVILTTIDNKEQPQIINADEDKSLEMNEVTKATVKDLLDFTIDNDNHTYTNEIQQHIEENAAEIVQADVQNIVYDVANEIDYETEKNDNAIVSDVFIQVGEENSSLDINTIYQDGIKLPEDVNNINKEIDDIIEEFVPSKSDLVMPLEFSDKENAINMVKSEDKKTNTSINIIPKGSFEEISNCHDDDDDDDDHSKAELSDKQIKDNTENNSITIEKSFDLFHTKKSLLDEKDVINPINNDITDEKSFPKTVLVDESKEVAVELLTN